MSGPAGRILLSFGRVLASLVPTTSFGYTVTQSCKRNALLKSIRLLKGSSWDSRRTVRVRQHSVLDSPARFGAFIAAKRRILATIQDAVMAGFLPQQPLVTRFAVVIEAATTADLEAFDDEDKATAKLYVQEAAQAADEACQQL